jgi:dCTP deaminase
VILRRGLLVDRDVRAALRRGDLVVPELEPELIRPAAVSLRLGHEAYTVASRRPVDVANVETYPELVPRPIDRFGCIVLHPREVLLARTLERVGLSRRLAGLLDGTSDFARLGISVVLAHQVSPGYGMPDGAPLTLEIISRLEHDVWLRPGVRIANLLLLRGRRADRPYGALPANHSVPGWSVASRLGDVEAARHSGRRPAQNLRPSGDDQVEG